MLFRQKKWRSEKVEKKSTFCKGVSPRFLSKNRPFSYKFFFWAKKQERNILFIFWIENKVFWTSKVKFSQSRKKSTFCKGVSPWFLSKNRPFSHMFLLCKKSHKETFFDILDRKECFLDLKSEVLKKSKKSKFSKGVSPWLFSKNRPFFICFFLAKKARKKNFFDILDS